MVYPAPIARANGTDVRTALTAAIAVARAARAAQVQEAGRRSKRTAKGKARARRRPRAMTDRPLVRRARGPGGLPRRHQHRRDRPGDGRGARADREPARPPAAGHAVREADRRGQAVRDRSGAAAQTAGHRDPGGVELRAVPARADRAQATAPAGEPRQGRGRRRWSSSTRRSRRWRARGRAWGGCARRCRCRRSTRSRTRPAPRS